MALKKRGTVWHLRIRPFTRQEIWVSTGTKTKSQALDIEREILLACKARDYGHLSAHSRAVCIKMFTKQGWQIPLDLSGEEPVKEELTLWQAVKLCVTSPEIRDSKGRERMEYSFANVSAFFGKDRPVKRIWIPEIREYMSERQSQGAAVATINREKSALSSMFRVLQEHRLVEANPARMVKRLSTRESERDVYLSREYVQTIANQCPDWYRAMIWTSYYSGMRRGEIVGLKRESVNLSSRIISLTPDETKERNWKRVPIHRDLVPILQKSMKVAVLGVDTVFVLLDKKGFRAPTLESVKNPWPRACKSLKIEKPRPVFHDLRHTWKTNALHSGMHPEIEKAIMGHSQRKKSVHEGYGVISDQQLIKAVDGMTFDHGETKIMVAGRDSLQGGEQMASKGTRKEKRRCGRIA